MATQKKKLVGAAERPRKHYCPEHGEEARTVLAYLWPGMSRRRILYICPQGCELTRKQTVKR